MQIVIIIIIDYNTFLMCLQHIGFSFQWSLGMEITGFIHFNILFFPESGGGNALCHLKLQLVNVNVFKQGQQLSLWRE
jgi:hypothetical protein